MWKMTVREGALLGLIAALTVTPSLQQGPQPENVVVGSLPITMEAKYRVTFTNNWTEENHPPDFPNDPHWSAPLFAAHTDAYAMWSNNNFASDGVKDVAEKGDNSELIDELEAAGEAVQAVVEGEVMFNEEQQEQTIEITLSFEAPYVSMVTMIADSPDWFSGFHDVFPVSQEMVGNETMNETMPENSTWYDFFELTLYPYDAGTDSGETYTASDEATEPPVPIFRLTPETVPPTNVFVKDGGVLPVAFVTFERMIVPPPVDRVTDIVEGNVSISTPVEYVLTFVNNWTEENHPPDFPNDPHWSAPVVAAHNDAYQMWRGGILATKGVQDVAEKGNNKEILKELEDGGDNVGKVLEGRGQFDPMQVISGVEVDEDHPYLSMITMIADSPDWFAGFHDVKPVSDSGTWYESFTVVQQPYDAGTDSGDTYEAKDVETDPPVPIFELTVDTVPDTMVFVKDGDVLPVAFAFFERVATASTKGKGATSKGAEKKPGKLRGR